MNLATLSELTTKGKLDETSISQTFCQVVFCILMYYPNMVLQCRYTTVCPDALIPILAQKRSLTVSRG
jgi:hypothetical protein